MHEDVEKRLDALYEEISRCAIVVILSMSFLRWRDLSFDEINFIGKTTPNGYVLITMRYRKYLLHAADFAVVPFQAFDLREESGWFRLSVGAVSMEEIKTVMPRIKAAMEVLK